MYACSFFYFVVGAKRLAGIFVGSRAILEQTTKFFAGAGLEPVVDRVFSFAEAKEAYCHLASGAHFGKVVVELKE